MGNNTTVKTAGLGAAVGVIVVWLMGTGGVDVPAEVAGAITAVISIAISYVVPSV